MKNQIKVKFFLFLSALPLSNIAIAASAKLNQIENDIQNEKILNTFSQIRRRIMPTSETYTTVDQAIIHFQKITGLQGNDLNSAFQEELKLLIEKKSILINSKGGIGGAPSIGG